MRTGLRRLVYCAVLLLATFDLNCAVAGCLIRDPELQSRFKGTCVEGLAEGYGEAEGEARYSGEFRRGEKSGKGVKRWRNGDRYEGEFTSDRRNGWGVYEWGAGGDWAGQRYSGHYVNDRRDGWGTFEWPNGDRYMGNWREDLRLGQSVFERRKHDFLAAAQSALGAPGTRVCRDWPIGTVTVARVVATTQSASETNFLVRIDEAPTNTLGANEGTVAIGQVLRTAYEGWWPC